MSQQQRRRREQDGPPADVPLPPSPVRDPTSPMLDLRVLRMAETIMVFEVLTEASQKLRLHQMDYMPIEISQLQET